MEMVIVPPPRPNLCHPGPTRPALAANQTIIFGSPMEKLESARDGSGTGRPDTGKFDAKTGASSRHRTIIKSRGGFSFKFALFSNF